MPDSTSTDSIPLVIYMSGADNVPKMDWVMTEGENLHLGCDPYITICKKGDEKKEQWPIKNQNRHPMWNSARDLGQDVRLEGGKVASGQVSIRLEMWDHDDIDADDFIGSIDIDPSELTFCHPMPFPLKNEAGDVTECVCYLTLLPPAPKKKTVYFVRFFFGDFLFGSSP